MSYINVGRYGPPLSSGGSIMQRHPNDEVGPIIQAMEATGMIRCESMEMTNDPRFFQDNVLNYRLAAFAGLSVVSGLMVQNAIDQLFDMDKRIRLNWWGLCASVGFVLLTIVLFLNMVSTYIGVAQPYHTIRLLTAGPKGFEAAACYYLNRNIIGWRHFAVKYMLASMPLFMVSNAFRMAVKYHKDNLPAHGDGDPGLAEPWLTIICIGVIIMFTVMAGLLAYIHHRHFLVFRRMYDELDPQVDLQIQQRNPRMNSGPTIRGTDTQRTSIHNYLDV